MNAIVETLDLILRQHKPFVPVCEPVAQRNTNDNAHDWTSVVH